MYSVDIENKSRRYNMPKNEKLHQNDKQNLTFSKQNKNNTSHPEFNNHSQHRSALHIAAPTAFPPFYPLTCWPL